MVMLLNVVEVFVVLWLVVVMGVVLVVGMDVVLIIVMGVVLIIGVDIVLVVRQVYLPCRAYVFKSY